MQHQCGLCSALSAVFRRLVCISSSRRGSQESYCLTQHGSGRGSDGTADPTAVLITMEDEEEAAEEPPRDERRRLSCGEEALVNGLDERRRTGRFLTVHKRRRRRLTTRALHEQPALLDDLQHGNVQCVLERVWQWPFNAFTLDTATGGRSLPVLCVHLFHWYGLMDHFSLDVVRIWKFFTLVEEGYHSTNPYHNAIHATDVTQAMHCFLQEQKIREHLTPAEVMCALIAAVTHDLDHPGVNQPFLIATSNHLAALYQNTSVLENHHWRSAIGCLLESNLAEQVSALRPDLERQISSLILATDITRQQEFLTRFKKYLDDGNLNMEDKEDRHFILQIALKCADISNPCRPWEVSKKWSQKVCEEFFRQGDYERQLNLPVTAICDRQSISVPKIQAGFFKYVVAPLFEEWHRFLDTPLSKSMMKYLRENQARWEAEVNEETKTDISEEVEELPEVIEEKLPKRRHSVPLSQRFGAPGTSHRRESLPEQRRRLTLGPILQFQEDEEISILSSPSLRSSDSNSDEKPVSAENLLPDVSIASITSSGNVQRLMLAPPRLTRQQTFPPVQPYVRARYMSTTAEILQGSISSSSGSSTDIEPKPLIREKENVDPDSVFKTQKTIIKSQFPQLVCKQRRGSAPVSLTPSEALPVRSARRGSVPADPTSIHRQSVLKPLVGKENSGRLSSDRPTPTPLAQGTDEERRRRRSKKILRRRSSGGPETFRSIKEQSGRRRGSLPIEVLSSSISGRNSSTKENMRH
ncbi:uncharacterized protein [Halyomorpha halys]|uniref:uncharacterized protein isoform X1 n=1 Tax=Halyomorpha halys TaxID=286706 RepID=UPI0034D255EB